MLHPFIPFIPFNSHQCEVYRPAHKELARACQQASSCGELGTAALPARWRSVRDRIEDRQFDCGVARKERMERRTRHLPLPWLATPRVGLQKHRTRHQACQRCGCTSVWIHLCVWRGTRRTLSTALPHVVESVPRMSCLSLHSPNSRTYVCASTDCTCAADTYQPPTTV